MRLVAYELTIEEPVSEAVRRCAREQLDRAIKALVTGIDADPVEAIHTARKSIKKARALLRLARGSLSSEQRTVANAILRSAAGRLSGLRDADVMLQTLEGLAEQISPDVMEAARARLEHERRVDSARAAAELAIEELRGVARSLEDWSFGVEGWRALRPGLRRTYRDARRTMRRAREQPSIENLHEWRKRVKDTWYEMRLLAPVCGPIVAGAAEEADSLAELLGDDHDLGVLREKVADLDSLVTLIDARRAELQMQAFVRGRRLYAENPRAFIIRLRRLWKADYAPAQPISSLRPNTRSNASSSP